MGFTIRKDSMYKTTIINPINFQTPKFFCPPQNGEIINL